MSPPRQFPPGGTSTGRDRPHLLLHTSVISYALAATSLAQTVISLVQEEDDGNHPPHAHGDDDRTDVNAEDDVRFGLARAHGRRRIHLAGGCPL